jgi:hypothetical protein
LGRPKRAREKDEKGQRDDRDRERERGEKRERRVRRGRERDDDSLSRPASEVIDRCHSDSSTPLRWASVFGLPGSPPAVARLYIRRRFFCVPCFL